MLLSRFVVTYENVRPGEHVLYDVLSDHYVGVDDTTLQAVGRWGRGQGPTADEFDGARVLEAEGIVVADRSVDDGRLRAHLDKAADGVPGQMRVTLMPTLACNLACTYCFQKDSPAFNRMSSPDEAATLEWILRKLDESGCSSLQVHYFGGEPLTRKDFVLRSAEVFSASMRARGGEFVWEITTNGINLDRKFAQAMTALGEGVIKVTLDGDKETHDKGRVWRSGKGTFDQIFANVREVAGHVKVRIGGNFRPGEGDSFERLLVRFDEAGITDKLESVNFKPIMDTTHQASGSCTGCQSTEEAAETRTLVQLRGAVQKRKLGIANHESLESMLGPCELHWKNQFTIDPDGYVYKCPAVAGRREVALGHVTSGDHKKIAPLVELRPWEQCGDCSYLPVCVGGCLGGKYLQTGRRDLVFCKKDQFEAVFQATIPQRYIEEFPQEDKLSTAA